MKNTVRIFQFGLIVFFLGLLGQTSSAQTWLPYNYWTFDGTSALADSMGRAALNPNYFGSTYTVSNAQSGVGVGKYMSFNGSEKLIVGSNPLAPDSGFTIEMLFRAGANMPQTIQIYSRRDGSINLRFAFPYIEFGTAVISSATGAKVVDTWDLDLRGIGRGTYGYYVDGNWHHLAFVFNAKTGVKEIWVDGELPATFTRTTTAGVVPPNTTLPNDNVCDFNTTSSYYKMKADLDEFATYTYALPGAMIYKHYTEFRQGKHYSFSNSTVAPPTPSAVTAAIDPTEFAPGHPSANVDALTQLKTFPAARIVPSTTLFPNIQVFNPAHIGGWLTSTYTNSQLISRSIEVQKELVNNYHYAFQVANNSGSYTQLSDTNTFTGAWVKLANQNPAWKISTNSYWPHVKPSDAGNTVAEPYISCGCQPAANYLRNSSAQFLDLWGNVVTNTKVLSPESPTDSITKDGLTQRFYLDQLTKKLTRPLDLVFENGEAIPRWTQQGLVKDPVVNSAFSASGIATWYKYMGRAMNRISAAYVNEFKSLPALANTRFLYYQINGNPQYSWDYNETRTLNSLTNGQYYSSGDVYMRWPSNWRYWSADAHGWQFVIDSRYVELTAGDKYYAPTVCPGWSNNEEEITRPAQWLGFLKALGMLGAEHFNTGYFVTTAPYQNPADYVWQMAMPGYAQEVTSRYEDMLWNGTLLAGDVPNDLINKPTQPGYMFGAGDMRKLVVARKHNTLTKYVITGTIQPNSNMSGNAELESVATIKLDTDNLKFKIRRQGSTYIYDKTNAAAPVFYQLDEWHESSHPYYWSKTFKLEGELFDNSNSQVEIKTEVPVGTAAGDYTNYTSYVTFKSNTAVEYNFTPRGTAPATHYLWVRARSHDNTITGFSATLDGTQTNSITCVTGADWRWYRFDATSAQTITYTNLSLARHKLTITANTTALEIDQITVTPVSGDYYTSYAPACSNGVQAIAVITAGGPTTFCQGGSVTLTANTGNSYLWSTGATTQSITATAGGNYIVTVTSAPGTATSVATTVTVNALPTSGITASGATTFCSGGSVTLTANSTTGTYLWTNGATTRAITVNATGNYGVTVTGTNGCTAATTPVAVVASSAVASTITAGASTNICPGSTVTLTANAGTAYLWSNGATTQSISVGTAGTYTVSVTQSGGCSTTSAGTAVTLATVTPATITASGPTSFCAGGLVTLTASPGTAYLWSNGATTQSLAVTTSGTYTVSVTQTGGCSATSAGTAVTVKAVTAASVSASGATTFCAGGNVVLTASAGTSYLWSNGATTQAITVTTTGNYAVSVTQSNGCSASSSAVAVTASSTIPATVSTSGSTTFCSGGNVTLTASSGTAYAWSNGATTPSITVSTAGSYSVAITQAGGCKSTSSPVTVTVGTPVATSIIASGSTSICQGNSVTLTATAGSSYVWSNGATTQSITVSTAGTYNVTVSQSTGCVATATAQTITVNSLPTATITAGGPTTFCAGGSVTLTASAGSSYLWSNGATTQAITATGTGNYNVTVTNSNGCSTTSATTAVSVGSAPQATITASGPTTFCSGGNVTLTASNGASYLWSNGATTPFITVSAAGTYTVRVTQTGGCSSTSAGTTVTIGSATPATITASGSTALCVGGSVTLTANTGTSYLWSNGATTKSITVSTAGNYNVTVTQSGGCASTSAATAVTVSSGSTPTVSASGSTSFCTGGSVTLTASAGASYLWSNGATTQAITVTTGGSYNVTVTQAGGCVGTSSATNVVVSPQAVFTVSTSGSLTFCAGNSVTFNVTSSNTNLFYVWYKNNVVVQSSTLASYKATTAGTYVVRVQLGGCGTFGPRMTVSVPCREGELPVEALGNFTAYPNPSSDLTTFAFELPETTEVSVRLYDLSGKLIDVILNKSLQAAGETQVQYSVSNLAPGLYFAEVETPTAAKRIRLSVVK